MERAFLVVRGANPSPTLDAPSGRTYSKLEFLGKAHRNALVELDPQRTRIYWNNSPPRRHCTCGTCFAVPSAHDRTSRKFLKARRVWSSCEGWAPRRDHRRALGDSDSAVPKSLQFNPIQFIHVHHELSRVRKNLEKVLCWEMV